jgi:enamine deaminase RidA (YjgF/YER057c/UK114 family)
MKKPKKPSARPKPRTAIRRMNPSTLYKPNGYTHVVEARGGRTIYLSGQTAVDKDGNLVGVDDFRAQVVAVFENLKAALAAAGAGFGDVMKANYYVLDMSNIAVLRDVRAGYLGSAAPASTLVEVRKLAREEFLVEIEMIAVCGK